MQSLGLGTGQDVSRVRDMSEKKANGMTLSRLRHDIRNHLNAIKLSCALLNRRRPGDGVSGETVREIEHAADHINELITRFMGDADAPNLLAELQPGQCEKREK